MNIAYMRNTIINLIDSGKKNFIIYPYGEIGIAVQRLLTDVFDIAPVMIIDNKIALYNKKIFSLENALNEDLTDAVCLLCVGKSNVYNELYENAKKLVGDIERIVDMSPDSRIFRNIRTKIGKYSTGPICCDNPMVESIGAFCCFAKGCAVVSNHEMNTITTHSMIHMGRNIIDADFEYSDFNFIDNHFKGVQPLREQIKQYERVRIGNDVWLGQNCIITNGANIGNGVVAAASSVVTKDIPDYAIVAGVPARVIRYRYSEKQIEALNKIAWWDWDDTTIRERFEDFYLPVDDFIRKFLPLA